MDGRIATVTPWAWGALFSLGVVLVAYKARALSLSGSAVAWAIGCLTFALGLWPAALTMIGFFASASGLSRLHNPRKKAAQQEFAKGARRDGWQVIANGGVATLGVLLTAFNGTRPLLSFAGALLFLGALAAATADTWATELGTLAATPRHILTLRRVAPGTSGGISLAGLGASVAGALWIACVFAAAAFLLPIPDSWSPVTRMTLPSLLGTCVVAGLGGSLIDSLLGATVQRMYFCPTCRKETEHPRHYCGVTALPTRGWAWVSNDVVNFVGTLAGGIIAVLLPIFACGFPR